MKNLIFILIFALFLTGIVNANDAFITNPNPIGGDLLAADTCDAPDLLFSQLPTDCEWGEWAVLVSDTDLGYSVYDDYEAFGSICNIQWWGIYLEYGIGWAPCEEDPMTFNINFCPDNGSGAPDEANPACTYTVTTVHNPDTVCLLDEAYQLWEWYTELDPVCNLQSGWVGIQGVGNGDTCVFLWDNSDQAFGYNSWQNGYTTYQQAFCLGGTGHPCLICDATGLTPRVPRVDGTIQWDLNVINCGSIPFAPIWGEIVPTNYDCNGPQFDFNLQKYLTPSLGPGEDYTGHYYYYPGTVAGSFVDVALWTFIGTGPNNYMAGCCFEFVFTSEWGRGDGNQNYWGAGQWGERDGPILPSSNSLGQNYPNPFNAETTIPFDLTATGKVKLGIYNLHGQLVETLVDDYRKAGHHTVNFDASTLSSGVYFYKLQIGSFVKTKKMNLLK